MSLRNRVAIAGGAVVLAALTVASLVLYPAMRSRLVQQRDVTLVSTASRSPDLLGALKKKSAESGIDIGPITRPVSVGSTLVQVLPPPLTEQPNDGLGPVSAHDIEVATGQAPAYFSYRDYNGRRYRVYTAALRDTGGGLLRTALPVSVDAATLRRLVVLLVALTLGGALLAAAAGRLAAGRVLRPVRRLTDTVEHVAATQDLTATIEARGRDEIGRLARSFATMMAELDESVQAQRRLVADASHELRTPLTSLTTNLELLGEGRGLADPQAPGLVADAREQAHELTVLVNDLIDLARYGRAETHTEDVRLDLLALRVVERAPNRDGLEFRTDLRPCLVHADPDAIERAVGNLIDNAVKWSPDGGRILVRVDDNGCLSVSDEGPGIPAADLPYVFDRFYRSSTSRSLPGSGLGLAIVRQIAETHGGSVSAEPLTPGVRLRLSLPAVN